MPYTRKSNRNDKRKHCEDNKCDCDKCNRDKYKYNHDDKCTDIDCGYILATLAVTVNPATFHSVGDLLLYSYTITNTGIDVINQPIKITDLRLGDKIFDSVYIPIGSSQTFISPYTVTAADIKAECLISTVTAHIQIKPTRLNTDSYGVRVKCARYFNTNTVTVTTCYTAPRETWDYIIVGLGAAGSILARKLSDDNVTRVLVLEAGENRQDDPAILNPNWFANVNDLLYNPKYAVNYPIVLGFLSADSYSEGAATWGGSSAHNAMVAVRGTPRIYDQWATISGNPIWSYSNLLPTMKALENYTPYGTTFDATQRGVGGPISVTQNVAVDGNTFLQNFSTYSNSPFYGDYNDPPLGNCCVSPVQQLVTPPAPNGTIRSYSNLQFLPVGSIIDADGNGLYGRKLKIISNARTLKFNVIGGTATSVEYVHTGTNRGAVLTAHLATTGTLILTAGSVQTSKLLLNSGIGPAAALEAVGIPVVLDSPNVGQNLQCQYGPGAIVGGPGAGDIPFEASAFCDGSSTGLPPIGYTGGPNDGVRRFQVTNNPLQDAFQSLQLICDPQSTGSIQIVDADPLVPPQINMNFYTNGVDGLDGQLTLTFFKLTKAAAEASGLFMIFPPPADYSSDATLLADALDPSHLVIQSHIVGTTRMGTDISNGVVDGNLSVFGLNNVKIADAGIAPLSPDGNPCLGVYYIALTLAKILGVAVPPAL